MGAALFILIVVAALLAYSMELLIEALEDMHKR